MIEKDKILSTLQDYADAYCDKDIARLMEVFVEGEHISMIGTGSDELCSGRQAVSAVFERNFAEATATKFEFLWKDVVVHGDAATIATTLNIHLELGGENLVVPIRWTVSLIKMGGQWKWIHRHASSAADTQEAGSAYPVAGQ